MSSLSQAFPTPTDHLARSRLKGQPVLCVSETPTRSLVHKDHNKINKLETMTIILSPTPCPTSRSSPCITCGCLQVLALLYLLPATASLWLPHCKQPPTTAPSEYSEWWMPATRPSYLSSTVLSWHLCSVHKGIIFMMMMLVDPSYCS